MPSYRSTFPWVNRQRLAHLGSSRDRLVPACPAIGVASATPANSHQLAMIASTHITGGIARTPPTGVVPPAPKNPFIRNLPSCTPLKNRSVFPREPVANGLTRPSCVQN